MNTEVKRLWIEALRSGQYQQGTGCLMSGRTDHKYCCLGVLTDLYVKAHPDFAQWCDPRKHKDVPDEAVMWGFQHAACDTTTLEQAVLHPSVAKWAGLIEYNPSVKIVKTGNDWAYKRLSELNDHYGYDFNAIAAVLQHDTVN